jgi:hypothetical protein
MGERLFLCGQRARSVVALACNLDFAGSRFLTGLTTVFVARRWQAPAGNVCALSLVSCRHHGSPFQKPIIK